MLGGWSFVQRKLVSQDDLFPPFLHKREEVTGEKSFVNLV